MFHFLLWDKGFSRQVQGIICQMALRTLASPAPANCFGHYYTCIWWIYYVAKLMATIYVDSYSVDGCKYWICLYGIQQIHDHVMITHMVLANYMWRLWICCMSCNNTRVTINHRVSSQHYMFHIVHDNSICHPSYHYQRNTSTVKNELDSSKVYINNICHDQP